LDWIAKRIQEAQKTAPVGATTAAFLERQLTGALRDRALRGAELAELARELIAATAPPTAEDAP
jgi:hypothetical protein